MTAAHSIIFPLNFNPKWPGNSEPSIDIPFAFSKSFRVYQFDGLSFHDQHPHDKGIAALEKAAHTCFGYLNQKFGNQAPLPTGRFLLTTRPSSGGARSNYSVLTDTGDREPVELTQFICHELAHFWSRGGNFGSVENWLNETFADYVANMALRDAFGGDAFEDRMEHYADQINGKRLPPI